MRVGNLRVKQTRITTNIPYNYPCHFSEGVNSLIFPQEKTFTEKVNGINGILTAFNARKFLLTVQSRRFFQYFSELPAVNTFILKHNNLHIIK